VRAARKILRERDTIISEAQQQADEVLKTAHEQAEMLLDQDGLQIEAQARANERLEEAMQVAQTRIDGADDYAREVLTSLQQQLVRHLSIIEKGISSLDSRE
jgi:vacuolar-type H+-ATPase subunit H